VKQRRLGESGLLVSVVGLGCNNFGGRLERDDSIRVVHAALDNGITIFDTADIYGGGRSEDFLGAALRDRRDRGIVATKFGMEMGGDVLYRRGGSRIYVRQAVEASLRRLQTDHIDLYQMHEPDPSTPIWETLSVLDDLVHEGKVRYIGSSNFSGWQISDAEWTARSHGWTRFTAAQNQYSLLVRGVEREVIPACGHHGIGMLPFFPLAAGMLTGKYRRGEAAPEGTRLARSPSAQRYLTPRNFDVLEALQRFAGERGVGLLSVAIGGLAAQPCVASVIAGAMTPEQVAANVAAGEWEPDAEERAEIDRITKVTVAG
jgi:aryl-alcohol dehydrogenase-like predicted oxidoreductase